jgi:hypothetical protein
VGFLSHFEEEAERSVQELGFFRAFLDSPFLVVAAVGFDDGWLGTEDCDDCRRDAC